jgi:hypothetical protein
LFWVFSDSFFMQPSLTWSSLCSSGWPRTHNSLASASWVLNRASASMPNSFIGNVKCDISCIQIKTYCIRSTIIWITATSYVAKGSEHSQHHYLHSWAYIPLFLSTEHCSSNVLTPMCPK